MGTYSELREIVTVGRPKLVSEQLVRLREQRPQQRFDLLGSLALRSVQNPQQDLLVLLFALVSERSRLVREHGLQRRQGDVKRGSEEPDRFEGYQIGRVHLEGPL